MPPAGALAHVSDGVFGAQERSADVDGEHGLPVLVVHRVGRLGWS